MKALRTTISEKGQVVIPKPLRDRLGLRAGQQLEMTEERGRLVARKVADPDPVDRAFGVLKLRRPVDDVMRELRGDPGDDDHGR
jgi:AbrB family looped-hinge helix DNA binding protein